MAIKPVLNLKNFSLGHSSSMASFLVPTTVLVQDVWPYSALRDFNMDEISAEVPGLSSLIDAFSRRGSEDNGHNAAAAAIRFVEGLKPEILDKSPEEFSQYVNSYVLRYRVFRYSTWVADRLANCKELVERAYESIDSETETDESLRRKILDTLQSRYPYSFSDTWEVTEFSQVIIQYFTELNLDDTSLTEGFVNLAVTFFQRSLDILESGGALNVSDEREWSAMLGEARRKVTSGYEDLLPPFFYLIRTMVAIGDLRMKQSVDEEAVKAMKTEFLRWFDNLRVVYNRKFVENYKASAVEFPYFLDLGFKEPTSNTEVTDTNGALMHSLERELTPGDAWASNYTKGDKVRIRDMFRIDKLNKKSAYESSALYPGMVGHKLDVSLEKEDVVTRLAQDDTDFIGVTSCVSTSNGMYFLSKQRDALSAAIRSTSFGETSYVQETNTFRSFSRALPDVDYLKTGEVVSTINFQRAYGAKSDLYSSGSDFLEWFNNYNRSVRIIFSANYSEGSTLKVLGSGCYEFYPANDGITTIEDTYDPDSESSITDEEVTRNLPILGFRLKASLADSSYKSGVQRKLNIEVPCNPSAQYSYVTFEVGCFIDSSLLTPSNASKDISLEFSVDDELPVRYYFRGVSTKKPENLTINSSLYYSLYDTELKEPLQIVPQVDTLGRITLKIENDLVGGRSKILHIGTSSNFAPLVPGSSEELRRAYQNSYFMISNPNITVDGVPFSDSVTYGNFMEYVANKGGSVKDFWNLSRVIHSAPHQYLLEVPASISINATKRLNSNYQTADLFSDVITLKNTMDSEYRMQCGQRDDDFDMDRFRNYTGMDSCSETISLYYDADQLLTSKLTKDNSSENFAQEYSVASSTISTHEHSSKLRFKRIETIKSVNRFSESIKHKSNLFSVIIGNSGADEALREAEYKTKVASGDDIKKAQENEAKVREDIEGMKRVIEVMTRNICAEYAPAHNQLFKVYFE